MTALCGGGASGPKTGVAETIVYASGAIASVLNNKGGRWASLVAPLLGVLSMDAIGFCSADPPADPTLTPAEYQALLELQPWDTLQTALGHLADKVKIAIWYELCECSGGGTPAFPSATLAAPAGVSIVSGAPGPCDSRTYRATSVHHALATAVPESAMFDRAMFPDLAPTGALAAKDNLSARVATLLPTSPKPTSARLIGRLVTAGTAPCGLHMSFRDAADTQVLDMGVGCLSAGVPFATFPTSGATAIPSTADHFTLYYDSQGAGTPTPVTSDFTVEFNCGSAAGAFPSPCTADPAVLAMLQQLLEQATLQQRWRLPMASVDSTVRTVTGTGSFVVDRDVGLRVELTAAPAGLRLALGNPTYRYDLGWLSVSDGGGMLQELRITRDSQEWFPAQCQLATTVGYALRDGVTVTITELKVEA